MQPVSGGEYAGTAICELLFFNGFPNGFPETKPIMISLRYNIIDLAGFLPKPKLTYFYVVGNAFSGGANFGEFVIMDHAGAVHADMGDDLPFHEVDNIVRVSFSD